MDGSTLTTELRRGTELASERVPTPAQCALESEALHASHAFDLLLRIIERRVERRRRQQTLPLIGTGRRMQEIAALAGSRNRKEPHVTAETGTGLARLQSAGEQAPGEPDDHDLRTGGDCPF